MLREQAATGYVVEKYYENVTMVQPKSISINNHKCDNRRFKTPANSSFESTARCSIILPAGSDFSKLEAYLSWLSRLGLPQNYEIIIINDRGLEIDHSQLLTSLPGLKVLNSCGVLNQSLVFDRGARAATGKYLLFVRSFVNFDRLVLEDSIRDIETDEQKVSISSNGVFLLVEKFHYAKAGGFAGLFGQLGLAMREDNCGLPANAGYFRNLYNDSILVKYGPGTFIDPEAIIDSPESVKIGSNCVIRKGVVIRPEGGEIIIADNCVINHYCVFHGKGGIYLADWTVVAPHCGFYAQNQCCDSFDVPIAGQPSTGKGIYLMGDNWIGAHSVICDDVTIGKGAIIGANSTVTKSIPMGSIAVGTPARVIKKRYTGNWDFCKQERAASEGMPQHICEHVRERARLIKELVEPQDFILDVGCGEGIITAILSEKTRTIIGCDYSVEALEIARKRHPDIEFVYSNSTSLAFSDRSFTKVVMSDVAEHLMPVQLVKALVEINRVLQKGGVLILATPITGKGKNTSTYAHIYEYGGDQLKGILSDIFCKVEIVNKQFGIFLANKRHQQ